MELIGKLSCNNISKIGSLPSALKGVSVKFTYQCIQIINNKEMLNGLKGSTKIQNRQSLFIYQPHIYNFQRKSNINQRGTKIQWNNKLFTSLNVMNGKPYQYVSNGILRHYHYWSD